MLFVSQDHSLSADAVHLNSFFLDKWVFGLERDDL